MYVLDLHSINIFLFSRSCVWQDVVSGRACMYCTCVCVCECCSMYGQCVWQNIPFVYPLWKCAVLVTFLYHTMLALALPKAPFIVDTQFPQHYRSREFCHIVPGSCLMTYIKNSKLYSLTPQAPGSPIFLMFDQGAYGVEATEQWPSSKTCTTIVIQMI